VGTTSDIEARRAADRELVRSAVLGSRAARQTAWESLIARFRGPLLATAFRVARGRAEECVDEFFQHLFVYNKLRAVLKHDPPVALLPYLRRALRNFAVKEFLRAVGRNAAEPTGDEARTEAKAGGPGAEDEVAYTELQGRIRAALSAQPIADRVCFIVRFYGPLTLEADELAWLAERSALTEAEVVELLTSEAKLSSSRLAKLCRMSPDAFYQKIHRTREKLSVFLSSEGATPGRPA
jgi:DNA-directed RNA polymerase specialized sigma24 family protein